MIISRIFAILAALVLAVTFTVWSSGGYHRGWSQDQLPTEQVDEITGIEFTTYEEGFRAGLDFVAGGVGVSVLLFVVAAVLAIRARRKTIRKHD